MSIIQYNAESIVNIAIKNNNNAILQEYQIEQ